MTVAQAEEKAGLTRSFQAFAADIKLAHSVFALPFAITAFILAPLPIPSAKQVVLLLLCMVGARSFAMGMNRYLDREVDKANPRTRGRAVPAGHLSPTECLVWSSFSGALLVVGAFLLNPLAGWLSLPLLVILASYSLMKRLSWTTHWYLGACLGFAPVAVSIALGETPAVALVALGAAVAFWTAGFDILYSLQDLGFDREHGLHSVPAKFGARRALWISRASFAAMIALLILAGMAAQRGPVYYGGVAAVAVILAFEHWLVRGADDRVPLTRINTAFFTANAWVSVGFLAFAIVDAWLA